MPGQSWRRIALAGALVALSAATLTLAGASASRHAPPGSDRLPAGSKGHVRRGTLPVIASTPSGNVIAGKAFVTLKFPHHDAGREIRILMGGLGTHGLNAPSGDSAGDVPLACDESLNDKCSTPSLHAGFAVVDVFDPRDTVSPSNVVEDVVTKINAEPRTLRAPWYFLFTKSIATGAYGTRYVVLVVPRAATHRDGAMQRVYPARGFVIARAAEDAFATILDPASAARPVPKFAALAVEPATGKRLLGESGNVADEHDRFVRDALAAFDEAEAQGAFD